MKSLIIPFIFLFLTFVPSQAQTQEEPTVSFNFGRHSEIVPPGGTIEIPALFHFSSGRTAEVEISANNVFFSEAPYLSWVWTQDGTRYPMWASHAEFNTARMAILFTEEVNNADVFLGGLRTRVDNLEQGSKIYFYSKLVIDDTLEEIVMETYAVGPKPTYGDVNLDGRITLADAALTFDVWAGTQELEEDVQFLAADVYADGWINTFDVYLQLVNIVNPRFCFPVEGCRYGMGLGKVAVTAENKREGKGGEEVPLIHLVEVENGTIIRVDEGAAISNIEMVVGNDVEVEILAPEILHRVVKDKEVKVGIVSNPGEPLEGEILLLRGISPEELEISGMVNNNLPFRVEINRVTPVEKHSETPLEFQLRQNYPNPFNPETTIQYSIPESGKVKLVVHNVLGQEVDTLVNEVKNPGTYRATFDASHLPSGIYIYRLQAGDFVETRRMMLIK